MTFFTFYLLFLPRLIHFEFYLFTKLQIKLFFPFNFKKKTVEKSVDNSNTGLTICVLADH